MKGYTSEIVRSSREFTARERLRIKDTTAAKALDELVAPELPIEIEVESWAEVHVVNENSKGEKEYTKYVIHAKDGNYYTTGSESFISAMQDIMAEMEGESEPWALLIYKQESKNYKGKYFITCTVA